jgi:hypothetical protein
MLFAVPIAGGAAVVVCGRSAPFTPSDENSCETIASTLVLHAAKPLPVAPNPAYAHAISTAVTKLDDAHTTLLSALRTARRPSAQASALSAFSTPCDRAASDFKASPAGPQEEAIETRIATAATAVCASYAQAESAARADDGARYAAAQTAAAAGERELDTAVASLRSIGYQV